MGKARERLAILLVTGLDLPVHDAHRLADRVAKAVALLLAGQLSATSAAADPEPRVGAHVAAAYTSNLFKEQDRRLSQFETRTQPGERYHGMQGPSDVVTTPGLDVGVGWKRHKRETLLSLGAEYAVHARNPNANYLALELDVAHDLTKRDALSLELTLTPSRFKKNYAYAEAAGTRFYGEASYLEWGGGLAYERKWTKRWRTELEVGLGQKRYEDPFANRDENAYTGGLSVRYDPWKRLALTLGVEAEVTRTPDGAEFGVRLDRSHVDAEPALGAAVDMPHGFGLEVGVAYRIRTYTTDTRGDGDHFDRVDRRWTLEGQVDKEFGRSFALVLSSSFADSSADRFDPTEDANAYGYQEFQVGVGCEYRYR